LVCLGIGLLLNPIASKESSESPSQNNLRYQIIEVLRNQPISIGVAIDITEVLIEECQNSDVPIGLGLSVIFQESQFRPWATSRTGARGLGQISPVVWDLYIKDKDLKDARWSYTPCLGVRVMIWFLGDLYKQYGSWDKALRYYYSGSIKKSNKSNEYVMAVMERARVFEAI
jgi:hypothetical protein